MDLSAKDWVVGGYVNVFNSAFTSTWGGVPSGPDPDLFSTRGCRAWSQAGVQFRKNGTGAAARAALSLSTQLAGCLPAGLHTGRGQGFPREELRLSGSLGCLHFLDASIFNLAQFLINCLCGER